MFRGPPGATQGLGNGVLTKECEWEASAYIPCVQSEKEQATVLDPQDWTSIWFFCVILTKTPWWWFGDARSSTHRRRIGCLWALMSLNSLESFIGLGSKKNPFQWDWSVQSHGGSHLSAHGHGWMLICKWDSMPRMCTRPWAARSPDNAHSWYKDAKPVTESPIPASY